MDITLKLLQSLQELGSEGDSTFPGIYGIIGSPQFPNGSELQCFDENGEQIFDTIGGAEVARKIEKDPKNIVESITISTTNIDYAYQIYDEFKEKYQEMLQRVDDKFKGHPCIWRNSQPSILYIPIDLKINEEIKAWNDPFNRVCYYVTQSIDKQKEELTISFFMTVWPCNNPREAMTRKEMKGNYPVFGDTENTALEITKENEKSGFVDEEELSKEEMKKRLSEKFKVMK